MICTVNAITYLYQVGQYEAELNKMWQSSNKEVKDTYGKQYIDGMYKSVTDYMSNSSNTMGPVVDSIELAVVSKHPNTRYLVDGGNGFVDPDNVSLSG